jgi:hypothetical protein
MQMMHRIKQVWQWMRSLPAKTWRPRPLFMKLANLLKQARSEQAHSMIPPLGILAGTVAFGLWWQNFAAALFAGVGLFFLAGIYKTSERMLASVRRSESKPRFGDLAPAIAQSTPENSDALDEAIRCLTPWLANEVSLTEEDVRGRCAVLVDSVAERARQMTTNR